MPIYEYQCSKCGHQLEMLQKVSEPPLTECPACHNQTLNKLVSAAGFQLKGTGWYVTDYSKKGKSTESSNENKSADNQTKETKTKDTKANATPSSDTSSNQSGTASS